MAQYDLNLRDYWRVLRRRKGVVFFVTLAFGALAYLFAQIQKPEPIYQATAVVKFERSTTLVGLLVRWVDSQHLPAELDRPPHNLASLHVDPPLPQYSKMSAPVR